ncbi:6-pyruvoyl-tetrahydropterin synthase-related protein [Dysgonomonas sp. 25]|uniref:6-pyruvoyl-tetrahydropterin synthase-related protein n=1 Tax=Dysgonomonas sp. 25 TaxID=2302933 RepID=UPI0013D29E8F|nr:6-pyruvoyl-tetrahydropterin synthase-related protein [Dysgonomonas sp. 25]NDV69709.1 hypothetical protein [Dysgonomonas sp. 25]
MKYLNRFADKISNSSRLQLWLAIALVTALSGIMLIAYNPIYLIPDSVFHMNRMLVLAEAIQNGDFPTYLDYNSIEGYGYFSKAFYPDFTLIPFAVLALFTDVVFAYKFLLFSTSVICGITTYMAVKRIYKSAYCAILVSLLFTFSSYKIFQTFYFSVIQEVLTFMFIPLVIWGVYEIIAGNYKKWYILTIGFVFITLTHLMTTVLLAMFVLLFLIIYYKRFIAEPARIKYLAIATAICIVLCAYFIFPMLEQMLSNSFYYQDKPLFTTMGYGATIKQLFEGITNNMANADHSYILPKIGGLLTGLICLRFFIKGKSKSLRSVDIMVVFGLVLVMLNLHNINWNIFPLNKFIFIQFPWRFLKYATIFFAIAGGFYLSRLVTDNKRKMASVLFLSVFLSATFVFDAVDYRDMRSWEGIALSDLTSKGKVKEQLTLGGGAEYLPSKMPTQNYPFERGVIVTKQQEETLLSNFKREKGNITVDVITQGDKLEMPLTYYKGYKASLDGKTITVQQSENGLIEVPIDRSGEIKVWYGGTTIQTISWIISLICAILFCAYIFYFQYIRQKATMQKAIA